MSLFHKRTVAEWRELDSRGIRTLAGDAQKAKEEFSLLQDELQELATAHEVLAKANASGSRLRIQQNALARVESISDRIRRIKGVLGVVEHDVKEVEKTSNKIISPPEYALLFIGNSQLSRLLGFSGILREGESLIMGSGQWGAATPLIKILFSAKSFTLKISNGNAVLEWERGANDLAFANKSSNTSLTVNSFNSLKDQRFTSPIGRQLSINIFVRIPQQANPLMLKLGIKTENVLIGTLIINPPSVSAYA